MLATTADAFARHVLTAVLSFTAVLLLRLGEFRQTTHDRSYWL